MTEQPLRIGLVGAGSIARVAELPALMAAPQVVIAGVVTRTYASAQQVAHRWPIERAYPSVEAMIEHARLDALFVLTPKTIHTPFVELGLRAGLDVFCEKPLASRLEEAKQLAALADATGRILMVGFNRRYAEVYITAREQFRERPVQFCVAQKNRPGSEYRATLENSIHMVDLLRWFCGEAVEVAAHAIAPDPYHEEGTMALIRFESGAIGALVAARSAGEWDERLDVYGGLTSVRVTAPDAVAISQQGETRLIEMRPRAMGWAQVNVTMGFGPEVWEFLACVRERRQPRTNAHEAVRTQELTEWVLRAAGLPLEDRTEQLAEEPRHGSR
ncbi:MAG: Gfo/Idh/MocA family oxidoreductase [Chloroflexi bacterium]|nr:Gfo/Idh/MocA family oxidoreductase [Chloroflexota bacterium]GIW10864.1 MAG: virulence factor MviM [Dehalococcoidia bacterium]